MHTVLPDSEMRIQMDASLPSHTVTLRGTALLNGCPLSTGSGQVNKGQVKSVNTAAAASASLPTDGRVGSDSGQLTEMEK